MPSFYYHNWPSQPSQRDMLSESIGGIDYDISEFLFSFDPPRLELFFAEYEKRHGRASARYARENFKLWKTRKKKFNIKSIEKFIQIAPIFLTYDQRYQLISKLYSKTRSVESYSLVIVLGHSSGYMSDIKKLFGHLCNKPQNHKLSKHVLFVLDWISDHDSEQSRKIMSAIETEYSLILAKAATLDLERLHSSILRMDSSAIGTHHINLPYGDILVEIRHPTTGEKIKKFFNIR